MIPDPSSWEKLLQPTKTGDGPRASLTNKSPRSCCARTKRLWLWPLASPTTLKEWLYSSTHSSIATAKAVRSDSRQDVHNRFETLTIDRGRSSTSDIEKEPRECCVRSSFCAHLLLRQIYACCHLSCMANCKQSHWLIWLNLPGKRVNGELSILGVLFLCSGSSRTMDTKRRSRNRGE